MQPPLFWISACLNDEIVELLRTTEISQGSGCPVLDCHIGWDGHIYNAVLKVYRPNFDCSSSLGPVATAEKHAMALTEFAHAAIPVPRLLGFAIRDDQAALLMEKIVSVPWQATSRVLAARSLAALHRLSQNTISAKLANLISQSAPNRLRALNSIQSLTATLDAQAPQWRQFHAQLAEQADALLENGEPVSALRSLVHGDYFSANLICREEGVCIIDWDLLAAGDPMWDLGFLIGADEDVPPHEVQAVIATYRQDCPVDMATLTWLKQCWDVCWELRRICCSASPRPSR
jgi:aminoglycoside phosphotransferase (APT) family kinase protein